MKNILKPIELSWMVSTTENELSIQELENNVLKVVFMAFFGNFQLNDESKYKEVSLLFSNLLEYRYFPEHSSENVERIDGYNWDLIPEFRDNDGSLKNHQDIFDAKWKNSGVCPNPSFYKVEESGWSVSSGSQEKEMSHYVVLSGDYILEVLAGDVLIEIL